MDSFKAFLNKRNKNQIIVKCPPTFNGHMQTYGANWNRQLKAWMFPLSIKFLEEIKEIGCHLSEDLYKKCYPMRSYSVVREDGFMLMYVTKPFLHQKKLNKLFLFKKKVLFLCDVGIGKSKAAIDSIYNVPGELRTLVVAPACTLLNFQSEVKKHSGLDSICVTGSLDERRFILSKPIWNIYIINYEMLTKLKDEIIKAKFDAIIFDEIHYLKNHNSKRTAAAYKVVKDIPYRIGLTGTLIANNIQDAFGPYKVIDDTIFGKFYTNFKNNYLIMGGYKTKWGHTQIKAYRNMDDFKKKLARNSLKFKIDDVVDLPPKIEVPLRFSLTEPSRTRYYEMMFECHQDITISSALEKAINLQMLCSGFLKSDDMSTEKLDFLFEKIEEIEDNKIVIWCRFRYSIDRIAKELDKKNISHLIYDGRTKKKDLYREFGDDPDIKILISQIQMGVGWEIPEAKYAIFYELDHSLINLEQAKGRNRRIKGSSEGSCVYMYLLAEDTIEERIYTVLQNKSFKAQDALEYVKGDFLNDNED